MRAEALPDASPLDRSAPTAANMRRTMGLFATGVTVITGVDDGTPVGFACQSFASVSLEPPLVLFCADHRGRAWPRIRTTGRFCVNVLTEHQVDLCERFGSSRGAKFDGLEWDLSPWGAPCLRDVLMRVHAEVDTVHVAGDHDVVVGRVLELESVAEPEELPMVFYRGQFGIERQETTAAGLPLLSWGWGDYWG